MGIQFRMEYNPMQPTLTVRQDNQPVSIYSQFLHCQNLPFWQWYRHLPDYCFQEANGLYSVHVTGSLVLKALLEKVCTARAGCSRFSFEPELITGADRMRLLEDLLRDSRLQAGNYSVDISYDGILGAPVPFQPGAVPHLNLHLHDAVQDRSDIVLVSSMEPYSRIARNGSRSLPKLAILVQNSPFAFLDEVNRCFLFSCPAHQVEALIRGWIADVLFPGYAASVLQRLRNCRNWNTMDLHSAMKWIDALSGNTPRLELSVTDPIELSSMGRFRLTKFPKDLSCRMYSGDSKVALLGSGGAIKPTGEGTTELVVQAKDHPSIRTSQTITVFRYKTVHSIRLTPSSTHVVAGDQITVQCQLIPADANNKSLGRWSILPASSMKILSSTQGIFQAVKPGRCEILYSIGHVQERLPVVIAPKPVSISFSTSSLSIKLLDTTQRINPQVHPQGAQGGTIKYKISNPGILDFDSNNGQITPKSEGNAVITAILLDRSGVIVDDCNCSVTILPPKDVVTPSGPLVLLIVSCIGAFLLLDHQGQFLCGITGLISAVWYSYQTKTKEAYAISVVASLWIVFLLCIGGML